MREHQPTKITSRYFNYKNQKNKQLGLIAQDIVDTKFCNLVKMIPEESLPDKQAMSVSYEEIIPILMMTLKNQQKQIEELKLEIKTIISEHSEVKRMMNE